MLINSHDVIELIRINRESEYEKSCSAECEHKSVIRSKHDAHVAFCDYLIEQVNKLPPTEPTLREKALLLLLDWAVECGFGYDNIPEEYLMYEKDIENMDYNEGLIYIAERELERNGRHDI